MRTGFPLRLVTAALLAACCALNGWAAGIDPDALTVADFSFMQGADGRFIDAYRVFLKAEAGDQEDAGAVPTYGQAARAFLATAGETADSQMRLRCAWFGTFCQFLDMDLKGAAQTTSTVLAYGEKPCPRETAHARDLLARVDSGQIASPGALIPLLRGTNNGGEMLALEEDVARTLAAILERSAQTREARQRVTTYALRTRLFDLSPAREQLRTIAVLAGFFREMSVSLSENREKLDQALCAANLRHLGVLLHLYAQDNDGFFPEAYDAARKQIWQLKVFPYTGAQSWAARGEVWHCPACAPGGYAYGINQNISIRAQVFPAQGSRDRIARSSETVLLADSVHYMPGDYPHKPNYGGAAYKIHAPKEHSGTGTIDWERHGGGANVLFVDGGVQWRSPGMGMEWTGR